MTKKPKMGRPPLDPEDRRVTLAVRVDPATKERLTALHEQTRESIGKIVDQAVAEYRPKRG